MSISQLTPDQEAAEFAASMTDATDTMQTIIEETLAAAEDGQLTESGRTACGDAANIHGPLARYPRSVDLQTCPRELTGAWHTHVTPDSLRHPEHSLPDMANVVYGVLDASLVVGADSADLLVRAADRDQMQAVFHQALGIEAGSPKEVVAALENGDLGDPAKARAEARQVLAPLLKTVRTGFEEFDDEIRALEDPDNDGAYTIDEDTAVAADPMYDDMTTGGLPAVGPDTNSDDDQEAVTPTATGGNFRPVQRMRESARTTARGTKMRAQATDLDLGGLVVSSIVGNIVGNLVDRYVFESR